MSVSFTIKAKPYSINQAYCRLGRKKKQLRDWEKITSIRLSKHDKVLADFAAGTTSGIPFDVYKHALEVKITFLIPPKKLITKDGRISQTSTDLSNIEKLFIDLVFKQLPRDMNDAYITDLASSKRPSKDGFYYIQCSIKLVYLPLDVL